MDLKSMKFFSGFSFGLFEAPSKFCTFFVLLYSLQNVWDKQNLFWRSASQAFILCHTCGLRQALSLFLPQPPPTYEESIRQSVQSIDVPFDILAPEEHPITVSEPGTDLPAYEALPHITDSQDPNNTVH